MWILCATTYLVVLTLFCFFISTWQVPIALMIGAIAISWLSLRPEYDLERHLCALRQKEQAKRGGRSNEKKNEGAQGWWLYPSKQGGKKLAEESSLNGLTRGKCTKEVEKLAQQDDPFQMGVHYLKSNHDARALVHDSWTIEDDMEAWSQTDTLMWINDLCAGIADQITGVASSIEKLQLVLSFSDPVITYVAFVLLAIAAFAVAALIYFLSNHTSLVVFIAGLGYFGGCAGTAYRYYYGSKVNRTGAIGIDQVLLFKFRKIGAKAKLLELHRGFLRKLRARNFKNMVDSDIQYDDADKVALRGGVCSVQFDEQRIDYMRKWEGYVCSLKHLQFDWETNFKYSPPNKDSCVIVSVYNHANYTVEITCAQPDAAGSMASGRSETLHRSTEKHKTMAKLMRKDKEKLMTILMVHHSRLDLMTERIGNAPVSTVTHKQIFATNTPPELSAHDVLTIPAGEMVILLAHGPPNSATSARQKAHKPMHLQLIDKAALSFEHLKEDVGGEEPVKESGTGVQLSLTCAREGVFTQKVFSHKSPSRFEREEDVFQQQQSSFKHVDKHDVVVPESELLWTASFTLMGGQLVSPNECKSTNSNIAPDQRGGSVTTMDCFPRYGADPAFVFALLVASARSYPPAASHSSSPSTAQIGPLLTPLFFSHLP
jgi:hypothetical protein